MIHDSVNGNIGDCPNFDACAKLWILFLVGFAGSVGVGAMGA